MSIYNEDKEIQKAFDSEKIDSTFISPFENEYERMIDKEYTEEYGDQLIEDIHPIYKNPTKINLFDLYKTELQNVEIEEPEEKTLEQISEEKQKVRSTISKKYKEEEQKEETVETTLKGEPGVIKSYRKTFFEGEPETEGRVEFEEIEEEEELYVEVSVWTDEKDRAILLRGLYDSIQNDDIDNFRRIINPLPLNRMTPDDTTELLIDLLNRCKSLNRREITKIILHRYSGDIVGFDDYEGEVDSYPILPDLFRSNDIDMNILGFIIKSVSDSISIVELCIGIFEGDESELMNFALDRLFEIVGIPDDGTCNELSQQANDMGNIKALDFINNLKTRYAIIAPVPSYIMSQYKEDEEEDEEEDKLFDFLSSLELGKIITKRYYDRLNKAGVTLLQDLFDVDYKTLVDSAKIDEDVARLIVKKIRDERMFDEDELFIGADAERRDILNSMNFDLDDIDAIVDRLTQDVSQQYYGFGGEKKKITLGGNTEALKKIVENMTRKQRLEYILPLISSQFNKELYENDLLNSFLGPCNPIVKNRDGDINHICYKYGGCRMLYCNCFENINAYEDGQKYYPNIPMWFKEICDTCGNKILKRCYAIRRPLQGGGWEGTYCSFDCMNNFVCKKEDDFVEARLIEKLYEKLNNVEEGKLNGITDRKEFDPYTKLMEAVKEYPEGHVTKYLSDYILNPPKKKTKKQL